MKKIVNERFHETAYIKDLENGLHVTILHKPQYQSTMAFLSTPFGSLDEVQKDENGNVYVHKKGIAHFLEHKLFESDHGDTMLAFGNMGAQVNAFTSFDETSYYMQTPSKDVKEALNLLLDFVQNLSISKESVEKEKKIIEKERAMYEQDASSALSLCANRCMYEKHPIIEDIVGTKQSIQEITVDDLYNAYRLNYHPCCMQMVIFTPIDPNTILFYIEENQNKKSFGKGCKLERVSYNEAKEVVQKRGDLQLDVNENRCLYGIKLEVKKVSPKELLRIDWCFKMALDAYFTSLNTQYEEWLQKGRISSYFAYEETIEKDYANIVFYDETSDLNAFETFVSKHWKQCIETMIKEEDLELLKRRALGGFLGLFDHAEQMCMAYSSANNRQVSIFEEIEMVEQLTPTAIYDVLHRYDYSNCFTVKLQQMEHSDK